MIGSGFDEQRVLHTILHMSYAFHPVTPPTVRGSDTRLIYALRAFRRNVSLRPFRLAGPGDSPCCSQAPLARPVRTAPTRRCADAPMHRRVGGFQRRGSSSQARSGARQSGHSAAAAADARPHSSTQLQQKTWPQPAAAGSCIGERHRRHWRLCCATYGSCAGSARSIVAVAVAVAEDGFASEFEP